MKFNSLVTIIFVFCMVSCHKSKPYVIDGHEARILHSECGRITVMGLTLFHEHIIAELDGNFTITPSAFNIQLIPDNVEVANLTFFHNDIEVTDLTQAIEVNGTETEKISIRFDYNSDSYFDRNSVLILLLPSKFIMCEDKPIITDTIKVKLK